MTLFSVGIYAAFLYIASLPALVAADHPAALSVDSLFTGTPWPAIRKARIQTLLPDAMRRAGVDAWLTVCRENDNDPLAMHVGGENAGSTAVFLFLLDKERLHAIAISPPGEAIALREQLLHDTVIVPPQDLSIRAATAAVLKKCSPRRIAVNSSGRPVTDGLSFTQRVELESALGLAQSALLVSSDSLVSDWLSVKLPEEIGLMRRAAALTARLQEEAYATVVPGITRDADVAAFLKQRMRELAVEDAWSPDQNPNVNSGLDRGHSHATDRVIREGDIIQTDFGIKVHGVWVSDLQRFAYVLRKGETAPPSDVLQKWENARRGSRIALAAMRPGVRGYDVDSAQRVWMSTCASLPVPWATGHPVGYWAHDIGPSLGGARSQGPPSGAAAMVLRPGQVFAYDGFFCWKATLDGMEGTKTISVEEMAVITQTGAEYLIPPQEELILIRPR